MWIVEASSVKDYLDRYYKPERRTPTLLSSYEKEYARSGYICTSRHDNITGLFIGWPKAPRSLPMDGTIGRDGRQHPASEDAGAPRTPAGDQGTLFDLDVVRAATELVAG